MAYDEDQPRIRMIDVFIRKKGTLEFQLMKILRLYEKRLRRTKVPQNRKRILERIEFLKLRHKNHIPKSIWLRLKEHFN